VANFFLLKRTEGGTFLSKRDRKKKYFAEGELRGPDANPEQISRKQNQLVGEHHCSKHSILTWTASTLQFPALLFLNTLAKNRQNVLHSFKKNKRRPKLF